MFKFLEESWYIWSFLLDQGTRKMKFIIILSLDYFVLVWYGIKYLNLWDLSFHYNQSSGFLFKISFNGSENGCLLVDKIRIL